MEPIIRPATTEDQNALSGLLNFHGAIHRHLDWKPAMDWLGKQPFWLMESDHHLLGALAIPPDPPHVAWVRLFVTRLGVAAGDVWDALFPTAYQHLSPSPAGIIVALVSLESWLSQLVTSRGFKLHQEIVLLEWTPERIDAVPLPAGLTIRPMEIHDLAQVTLVDQSAFEPVWQNSLEDVTQAYGQSAYATVALFEGQVVGFQISTGKDWSAHLGRLAVLPACQSRGVGMALVRNLQQHFWDCGQWHLTVNTQSNNNASLSLYQKAGFLLTGDRFPVFIYSR